MTEERAVTRRTLLTILPLAAAAPVLLRIRQAQAQQKADPKLVKYQETPKDKQECDKCLHFVAPNACKLVAGKINPKGWCMLYALKS